MNTQSIIPQSDDRLLSYFLSEIVKHLFNIGNNGEKEKRQSLITFILLGLIAIVATEPFKVLLRKNIGKLALSMPRLITASVLYLLWATLLFCLPEQHTLKEHQYRIVLYAGGIFYVLFALLVLIAGISEYSKAKRRYRENPNQTITHLYRGDSVFFKHLVKKGENQNRIWMKKEPLICFLVGLTITILPVFRQPVFILIGLPILLTSLSFWFNEWFQIKNVWNVQTKKVMREKEKSFQSHNVETSEEYMNVTST